MNSQALFILCLNLVAVSQTALGQSPATAQGESEGDLSGTWSVTVHLTTKEGSFLYTEAHDYTARMTFVHTRSFTWIVHSAASGNHTISIRWGMGNPTSAVATNRTLLVEAAALPRPLHR